MRHDVSHEESFLSVGSYEPGLEATEDELEEERRVYWEAVMKKKNLKRERSVYTDIVTDEEVKQEFR